MRRVSLEGQLFHPDDDNARLYPLFFCRECGQEHHSVSVISDLDGDRIIARPIDEPARDEVEADGTRTGFLVPAVNADFEFSRSEEHTSELQSLMRISYAVFCLKKQNNTTDTNQTDDI